MPNLLAPCSVRGDLRLIDIDELNPLPSSDRRLYPIPEPEYVQQTTAPGLVATECACSPSRKEAPMGSVSNVIRIVVQCSKKYAFRVTIALALFNIGWGYLQTRDSGRADCAHSARYSSGKP